VGCDIELVEPRSAAFVEQFLTAAEGRTIAAAADPALAANLCWSAKESLLKALRVGLARDLRELEVRAGEGHFEIDDLAGGGRHAGRWQRLGAHVITVVVIASATLSG
jgi:4'-phosphopantetheinyl transferase